MWTTSRVICWELEHVSRKDGHHQQQTAITVTTLPGVGTAVRELKTRRGPTAKAERSEAGRRVGGGMERDANGK